MNLTITLVHHKSTGRHALQQMAFDEAQNKAREKGRQVSRRVSSEPAEPPAPHEDIRATKYVFETKEGTAPGEGWAEIRGVFKKMINEQNQEGQ